MSPAAKANPSADPTMPSSKLSVSSCRLKRAAEAPSAWAEGGRPASARRGRADHDAPVRIDAHGFRLDAGRVLHGEMHDPPLIGEHRLERHRLAGRAHARGDPLGDLPLRDLRQLQREGDVLLHGEMRVQGVALEHHGQVPVAGRLVGDDLVADAHLALGHVLEPHDHPQQRRLPAAGRPDQDHELAVLDLELDVVHGLGAVREPAAHVLESDAGHTVIPSLRRT